MLLVLVALVYLYISAGVRVFSTWRHARHDNAVVSKLAQEHQALVRQHNVLSSQAALEAGARKLGLARPGEQPYVVTHLPPG
jgi:cell division protein FtsB